jgi:anti-sigma-K factor RskA
MSKVQLPDPSDERVPLFGTWRAIYVAVAASALAVMALLALFSRWPF